MFPHLLELVLLEFTLFSFTIAISTSEGWDHALMVQLYIFLFA
jgi:hypothetical protein